MIRLTFLHLKIHRHHIQKRRRHTEQSKILTHMKTKPISPRRQCLTLQQRPVTPPLGIRQRIRQDLIGSKQPNANSLRRPTVGGIENMSSKTN
jgi:hypothetical protein